MIIDATRLVTSSSSMVSMRFLVSGPVLFDLAVSDRVDHAASDRIVSAVPGSFG